MGMIQTESPYYLPTPQAPAPFDITLELEHFQGDPDFKECSSSNPHCAAAWGLMITGSTNVQILGAGLYNWYQDYTQPCVDTQDCQQRVVSIEHSGGVWIYNLYTIGTVEMVTYEDSTPIKAKTNTNTNEHPFTSVINAWLVVSAGKGSPYYDDIAEIEDYIVDKNLAACNSEYHTLDQISSSVDGIPDHCFDTYIVQVELEILNKALNDFDAIVGDGYDRKFDIYERVVRHQAPASVDAYMSSAQATGIWHCNSNKYVSCCKDCVWSWGCAVGCDKSQDCVPGKRQTPVDCPTRISDPYDIYSTPPDELFYTVSD
ncbi:hypothetical protein F5B22DRAFT_650887 [Xylaria bambusicola]|uniref:uncharacterized protein n=1 Tax=Xylaria bambusicola TaxID=326684 RepID=UPI00200876A6|nr:uncharacterized protein F5B22DRAFT_650887 [Xylaria bambusicola]KAI0506327.1 hypothetical protein F5B22DRAFT_650887 [Xylaria bambusicola]